MKRTLIRAGLSVMTVLCFAIPAFAQGGDAANNNFTSKSYAVIAAGIGFAIAAGLAGLGQARVAAAACEGIARNPGAGARIQTAMILGLAFIETLVIFTLVIMFAIARPIAIS